MPNDDIGMNVDYTIDDDIGKNVDYTIDDDIGKNVDYTIDDDIDKAFEYTQIVNVRAVTQDGDDVLTKRQPRFVAAI
jgi:hypothetical protein